jgi:hypothetical protein
MTTTSSPNWLKVLQLALQAVVAALTAIGVSAYAAN